MTGTSIATSPVLALFGKKVGMTQVFDESGVSFAVSVVAIAPNLVVDTPTLETRGYVSTALGVGEVKKNHHNRMIVSRFNKLKTTPKKLVKEIRNMRGFEVGSYISLANNLFSEGDLVNVVGISKGKGFAGAIKRHNQHLGPKSHGGGGGSKPIRQVGSIGDITGNKVFKGMNMPGRMGGTKTTIKNLSVTYVAKEEGFLLIKGAIPGPRKGWVLIKKNPNSAGEYKKRKTFTKLL